MINPLRSLLAALLTLWIATPSGPALAQCSEHRLDPLDPFSIGELGSSLAHDGSVGGALLMAGAPAHDGDRGKAVLYAWTGSTWSSGNSATDIGTAPGARMGAAVARDGVWFAAGAPGDGLITGVPNSGAVSTRRQNGPGILFGGYLTSPVPTYGNGFGSALAISSDLIVVGEPGALLERGAIHVFRREGAEWIPEQTIFGELEGDRFGSAVSIDRGPDRNILLVGAPGSDELAPDGGRVEFFIRVATAWFPLISFASSDDGAALGSSVDVHADVAIVGAPLDGAGGSERGSITIFRWQDSTFVIDSGLDGWRDGDHLGSAVAIDGALALAGVPGYDGRPGDRPDAGGAILLKDDRNSFLPAQAEPWYPLDLEAGDGFGASVALSGDLAVIGSPLGDGVAPAGGAAHAFDLGLSSWRWEDLGQATSGTHGKPELIAEGPFCTGEPFRLALRNAKEEARVIVIAGLSVANSPLPGGFTIVPEQDLVFVLLEDTTPDGIADVDFSVPAALTSGMSAYLQFGVVDPQGQILGAVASTNAVGGTVP